MDQLKIGKFIADSRKAKGLTQMQLAEQLGITDKAVSKWERGIAMPDSSIMLDVCAILGISVNELLSGEKINMEEENKKTQELLLELKAKEERLRKQLYTSAWAFAIIGMLLYIAVLCLSLIAFEHNITAHIIVSTLAFITVSISGIFATRMEMDAGHYICRKCNHEFEATSKFAIFILGYGTPKNRKVYLRCPKCGKKTWTKRVLPK